MHENTKNVLIFSDPGLDDALAIVWLLNQSKINIIGTIPVAGNHSVYQVTRNMIKILKNLGRMDIPVYLTDTIPQKYHQLANVHGHDAMGDFIEGKSIGNKSLKKFDEIFSDINNKEYEIISLAPCTILARFLKEIKKKPLKITIMGGLRNVKANYKGGEFNIGIDENSAIEVFSYSTCPINMIPLDVTRQYFLSNTISDFNEDEKEKVRFFRNLCKRYLDLALIRGKNAFPHDLTAALTLLHSDIFSWDIGNISLNSFKIDLTKGIKDKVATKINVSSKEFESIIMEGFYAL
ncbi:MAG: nucleoside hydrolase [Clostridiales bacterium]